MLLIILSVMAVCGTLGWTVGTIRAKRRHLARYHRQTYQQVGLAIGLLIGLTLGGSMVYITHYNEITQLWKDTSTLHPTTYQIDD